MLNHPRDAMQDVKSLAFQRIPVAVTSTYKGMFFEDKVAPLEVGPDYIVFKAPKPQICLNLRYQVWLHSHVLPESVRATLQTVHTASREITLTNFAYTGDYWRDRQEQRIEPANPVHAKVNVAKQSFPANLTNLSLHGAGLLVYLGDNTGRNLVPKSPIEVCFTLTEQNKFHILGTVASCRQMGYSVIQVGVHLQPTLNQAAGLDNYITKRKIEILQEIDEKVANRALSF